MAYNFLSRSLRSMEGPLEPKLKSEKKPDEKDIDWADIGLSVGGKVADIGLGIAGMVQNKRQFDEQMDFKEREAIEDKRRFKRTAAQTDRAQGLQGLDYLSNRVDRAGAMAKSGPSFRDAISRALRG